MVQSVVLTRQKLPPSGSREHVHFLLKSFPSSSSPPLSPILFITFCSLLYYIPALKSALPDIIIPIITPNNPKALAKISTTNIFTNNVELAASDSAALLPTTPTHNPHAKLDHPVTDPAPRIAYPAFMAAKE
jgi:hypothetical protein